MSIVIIVTDHIFDFVLLCVNNYFSKLKQLQRNKTVFIKLHIGINIIFMNLYSNIQVYNLILVFYRYLYIGKYI